VAERSNVQIHNSKTVFPKKTYSGLNTQKLDIKNGARIVFTMYVFSIDAGASVKATIKTSFSEDMPFYEALTLNASSITHIKGVLSDFHNFVDIDLEVIGGSAEVILGMNVYDNALTTRIDNAEISVDLNHNIQNNGQYDSVRIGDGVEEVAVNPDGSINVNVVNTSVVPEVVKNISNKITNVVKEIRTSVVSHIAQIGKETYIQLISVNGDNVANYELEINENFIDQRNTYFGSPLAEQFIFNPYSDNKNGFLVPEGQKIEVFVTHYREDVGNFNSRIQILEIG
jgi:hypothetical protein